MWRNNKIPHKSQKHTNKTSHTKTLQVIGGVFRGLKLFAPLESSTRPTKAILKESLFNTLGREILQTCFIEAFSGSGSIGIEALSRGAKRAIFFENDANALNLLRQNLALIPAHMQVQIIAKDSFSYLLAFLQNLQESSILYLDPPFLIRQNYADIYQRCANLMRDIESRFVEKIIIEHMSSYSFPDRIGQFANTKYRKFGKSALTYFSQGE